MRQGVNQTHLTASGVVKGFEGCYKDAEGVNGAEIQREQAPRNQGLPTIFDVGHRSRTHQAIEQISREMREAGQL